MAAPSWVVDTIKHFSWLPVLPIEEGGDEHGHHDGRPLRQEAADVGEDGPGLLSLHPGQHSSLSLLSVAHDVGHVLSGDAIRLYDGVRARSGQSVLWTGTVTLVTCPASPTLP